MARFIFVTGGVVSSLGKGLLSASLGALLQSRGYKVRIRKFDPYLNVDPGTMSPYQHGEVYVTDDGAENDLGRDNTVSVHTTLVPWIAAAGELKTKPTQHSVRELSSLGVQPDVLLCRCEKELPEGEREKIALFCNVRKDAVIPALDARNIYDVPLQYHEAGLDDEVLRAFGITDAPRQDLARWREIMDRIDQYEREVTIGLDG